VRPFGLKFAADVPAEKCVELDTGELAYDEWDQVAVIRDG